MTLHRPPEPLDEDTLRAWFADVELPDGLEAKWRERVALAGPATRRFRLGAWLRSSRPWLRSLVSGVVVLTAGGVVGVVAANRPPAPAPDPNVIETISIAPPTASTPPTGNPSQVPEPGAATSSGTVPPGAAGPNATSAPNAGTGPQPGGPPAAPAPARGPLADWPNAGNAGLPPGTTLGTHAGDLHLGTPGEIVANLRVTGTVYVEAPNVTLRRVQVTPPWGGVAAVRQLPGATGLRIEDSEISGGGQYGIRAEAAGLTVQRSSVHDAAYSIGVSADVTVVDSFLPGTGSQVLTTGNAARLTVRHNTIGGAVEITDQDGPVTDVTIESNQLRFIWAPSGAGSHGIRVTSNQFHRDRPDDTPVGGWNAQASGNAWTGNVWFGTSEPANP